MRCGGLGRLTTHLSPSCLKSPVGIAVPGLICEGSSNQRKVQSGLSRSLASKKLGAIAFASCPGSPVMWHFKHGVPAVNICRATNLSSAESGWRGSRMYGSCWPDIAIKNLTSACSSFGEKLKVGIRNVRYGRTPFRSNPGCGLSFAPVLLACGDADGEALGLAAGEDCGAASALIFCCCCVVFSPLNEGSWRNFSSQLGSTRAPSLVRRGGNRSL